MAKLFKPSSYDVTVSLFDCDYRSNENAHLRMCAIEQRAGGRHTFDNPEGAIGNLLNMWMSPRFSHETAV
jgi:hypothetical protein